MLRLPPFKKEGSSKNFLPILRYALSQNENVIGMFLCHATGWCIYNKECTKETAMHYHEWIASMLVEDVGYTHQHITLESYLGVKGFAIRERIEWAKQLIHALETM